MDTGGGAPAPLTWLYFSFVTVASFGLYGIFLHTGQTFMADPENGRYKAFLFVGLAYFLTAVLLPLGILFAHGVTWSFPMKGMLWSLGAGILGATGAFFILLAFGAKGHPAAVMAIVFAGAPIVNAIVAILMHPPQGGFSAIRWQFVAGILLAALGGFLVSYYKPGGPPPARHPVAVETPKDTSSHS